MLFVKPPIPSARPSARGGQLIVGPARLAAYRRELVQQHAKRKSSVAVIPPSAARSRGVPHLGPGPRCPPV